MGTVRWFAYLPGKTYSANLPDPYHLPKLGKARTVELERKVVCPLLLPVQMI